jgi:hypothetical protein
MQVAGGDILSRTEPSIAVTECYHHREMNMDFKFTAEQEMLRDTVRRFVDKEIPPEVARETDEKEEFPHELLQNQCCRGIWRTGGHCYR